MLIKRRTLNGERFNQAFSSPPPTPALSDLELGISFPMGGEGTLSIFIELVLSMSL